MPKFLKFFDVTEITFMYIVFFFQGEWIWILPTTKDEFSIPIGVRTLRNDKSRTYVRDDEGSEFWVPSELLLKNMHITSQNGVDDMITLGDLQEYAILRNLHLRYMKKHIYVSIILFGYFVHL